jgi:3'-5' exoribonuclease
MRLPYQPRLPKQPKKLHQPDDVLPSPIPTLLQTHDVQDLQKQIAFTDASLLPRVMRIVKITIAPNGATNEYRHQAVLYAQGVHIAVEWVARQRHDQLTCNGLVTIAYKGIKPASIDGYLQIIRLCRLDRPDMSYNLFETTPPDWFINKDILSRAIQAWEQLDDKNKHLLNAICFEGDFFKRFCIGPSSVGHHHNYLNGNLEHTLEVVNFISDNIAKYQTANLQLALIYGWLHDIGKADEYQPCKTEDREFKLTPSAYLHGHKLNGLHLVIKAQARHVPLYPEKTFDHLRHLLEPHPNLASSDTRKAQMLEHLIVQQADAASAAANVYGAAHRPGSSFGIAPESGNGKGVNFRYEK